MSLFKGTLLLNNTITVNSRTKRQLNLKFNTVREGW